MAVHLMQDKVCREYQVEVNHIQSVDEEGASMRLILTNSVYMKVNRVGKRSVAVLRAISVRGSMVDIDVGEPHLMRREMQRRRHE